MEKYIVIEQRIMNQARKNMKVELLEEEHNDMAVQIETLKVKHAEELGSLKVKHAAEIEKMKLDHNEQIENFDIGQQQL